MDFKKKPETGKAILFGIIGIIAFYICYAVIALVLSALLSALSKIPLLGNLIIFLFRVRGDTPGILVSLIAVSLAYEAVLWMIHRFSDIQETEALALRICGIPLLVLNMVFLIVNLLSGDYFFPNILLAIAGFLIFNHGRST